MPPIRKRKPAPQFAARYLILAPFAIDRPVQQAAGDGAAPTDPWGPLGEREFQGIASVYSTVFYRLDTASWERVPTILEPGAWNQAVAEINSRPGDRAGRVPLLRNHAGLLGRTVHLEAAADGLRFRARVTDEPDAMAWYAHVQAGAADGISVGFGILESRVVAHAERGGEQVEHVATATLSEVTSCIFGANPGAMVEQAASMWPEIEPPQGSDREDVFTVQLAGLKRELQYAHERIDVLTAQLRLA